MHPQYSESNQKAFDYLHQLISDAVTLGCDLMNEDRIIPHRGGPENIPPVVIFRHFIDVVDSIGILIKAGSGDTPKVFLRSALESLLYLEYIFQDNTWDRCLAYMVKEIHREINVIKKYVKMNSVLRDNGYTGELPFRERESEVLINEKNQLLSTPLYRDIDLQFAEMKKNSKGHRDIKWYQLESNANSVEQLAAKLGYMDIYEVFYRKWSSGIHSTDLYIGRMSPNIDMQTTNIVAIRHPNDVYIITEHTLRMSSKACSLYLQGRLSAKISVYSSRIEKLYNLWNMLNEYNLSATSMG